MHTPPPSPPISLSLPSAGERLARCTTPSAHSSPPPVPSLLLPSSGCPTQIQTVRIASTQALVDAVTAALPSPPLPPLPPSLYIPPHVDHRDDIPESERPPYKRSCLSDLGFRYEVRESSTARPTGSQGVDYGFVSTLDADERRRGIREVGYGIRDTWYGWWRGGPILPSGWAHLIGLSQATHQELQTHRDHVYAHETHLQAYQTQLQLQKTDRRRQDQMVETLRVIRDMRREMSDMQAELLALREQRRRAR
ncbi:hypothetical protein Tco_0527367 [Tanacetum coccineum]